MVSTPPDSEGHGTDQRAQDQSQARAGERPAANRPQLHLQAASRTSCCHQPDRELLVPYALSRCAEEDALVFEAHLLACESCFHDLKVLDRAGVLIREFTASGARTLDPLLSSILRSKGLSAQERDAARR